MKHKMTRAEAQEILERSHRAVEAQRQIVMRYQRQFLAAGVYMGPIDGVPTSDVELAYYEFVGSEDLAHFWDVVGREVAKEISK